MPPFLLFLIPLVVALLTLWVILAHRYRKFVQLKPGARVLVVNGAPGLGCMALCTIQSVDADGKKVTIFEHPHISFSANCFVPAPLKAVHSGDFYPGDTVQLNSLPGSHAEPLILGQHYIVTHVSCDSEGEPLLDLTLRRHSGERTFGGRFTLVSRGKIGALATQAATKAPETLSF